MRSDASAARQAKPPTEAPPNEHDDLEALQQLNVRLKKVRINQIKRIAGLRNMNLAEYLDELVRDDVTRMQDALRRSILQEQERVRREMEALEAEVGRAGANRSR